MIEWTYAGFVADCEIVVRAMQEYSNLRIAANDEANDCPRPPLVDWSMERPCAGNNVFLSHPPFILRLPTTPSSLDFNSNSSNRASSFEDASDEDHDEALLQQLQEENLVDPTLESDPYAVSVMDVVPSYHPNSSSNSNSNHSRYAETTETTEWKLSIVYSDTWSCPVLYFTVHCLEDGRVLSRDQVVQIILLLQTRSKSLSVSSSSSSSSSSMDMDEFVSFDEHPITGTPSLFLHPCRTGDRLRLLLQASATATAATAAQINDGRLLLSWMSMILPSIGQAMPSRFFQQVVSIMSNI